ncbi:hypothetical protein QR680_005288 [Steinernema hermaphroditum]|uniref:Uncharacterized protein n=1 Tax=Steinernema hermaphroditum TaxID=289476 RepID=A0AA39HTN4_9BILA|nr:hypothetical protein QR680_005288 [Steinernema hermaphroditum]
MAKFYKHVKDIVHSGVNDVLLDMFRIQTMIGFCANTTYGEQERIDAFMSRAAEIVGRIADHTEKWRINNEKKLRGVQLMPSYENAEEGMQHGEVTGAEEQEWNRRRNETHGEAPPKPIDAQD